MFPTTNRPFLRRPAATRIALMLICCFGLTLPSPGQVTTQTFRLQVAPAETTLGEKVRVTLHPDERTVRTPQIEAVQFEPGGEEDWEIEGQWTRDWATGKDGKPGLWHAYVRPFKVGEIMLPAARITYKNALGVAVQAVVTSATLLVRGTIPEGSQSMDLVPMRDLAVAPRDWSLVWWLGGGVLAAALLALLIYRFAKGPRISNIPAEPPLPPGLWALRELERRSRLPVCQQGPAKTIYSMVSEVMRLYIGRRYGVDAIDMTSRECLSALGTRGLNGSVHEWLRQFFDECDLVKFSRVEVPRERWCTIWNDAKIIVQNTTPPEELNETGEAGAPQKAAEAGA